MQHVLVALQYEESSSYSILNQNNFLFFSLDPSVSMPDRCFPLRHAHEAQIV